MSFTFQANTARGCPGGIAFTRSQDQARNLTKGSISAAISMAIYPLWGFGTFSNSFNPNLGDGLSFNTTWPFVYSTLTCTTVTPTGTSTGTRTYQTTVDTQTITTPNFPSYGTPVLSYTITPTLVTVVYGDASNPSIFTAALSGTILDNTLPGPFNPDGVDSSGLTQWEQLTQRADALLKLCPLPILEAGIQSNWIQPVSNFLSPLGYAIQVQGSGTVPICAAARGLPLMAENVFTFADEFVPPLPGDGQIATIGLQLTPGASNCDWVNPYNLIISPPSVFGNYGAVVSLKSSWTLTGKGPVKNVNGWPSRLQAYVTSNNHLSIYKQPWTPSAAAPGINPGAPGAALKTFTPGTQYFDPGVLFSANEYGVIGFLPAAS